MADLRDQSPDPQTASFKPILSNGSNSSRLPELGHESGYSLPLGLSGSVKTAHRKNSATPVLKASLAHDQSQTSGKLTAGADSSGQPVASTAWQTEIGKDITLLAGGRTQDGKYKGQAGVGYSLGSSQAVIEAIQKNGQSIAVNTALHTKSSGTDLSLTLSHSDSQDSVGLKGKTKFGALTHAIVSFNLEAALKDGPPAYHSSAKIEHGQTTIEMSHDDQGATNFGATQRNPDNGTFVTTGYNQEHRGYINMGIKLDI